MAAKYNIIQKGNPSKPKDPKKFYASNKSTGDVSLRALSKEISSTSTVSAADVMAVLEGFIEIVPKLLSDGKIVRLGDFGSLSIVVKSEGKDKESEVTAKSIIGTKIKFRAGAVLNDALSGITFEKESK
jgi:predicted histone-like DNA-binding protein